MRLWLLLPALLAPLLAAPILAEDNEGPDNSWAFGQSLERGDAIWKNGVGASEIKQNALPPRMPNAADTRRGVDRAVNDAIKRDPRASLGMSMENDVSRWKADPEGASRRPDEDKARDRKRVFRAYADIKGGDDWNISVGPELIVRDEEHGETGAAASEPDSTWGLGMKFKYDF